MRPVHYTPLVYKPEIGLFLQEIKRFNRGVVSRIRMRACIRTYIPEYRTVILSVCHDNLSVIYIVLNWYNICP